MFKNDLNIKILNEEYGKPDFAPLWQVVIFVIVVGIIIAAVRYFCHS